MKTSARNHFSGTVKDVVKGPVSTAVPSAVASGVDVVATISTRSGDARGLAVGKAAHALVKASSVIVGVD